MNALVAVLIAFVFITAMSLIREPHRQKISAILIAGAGAVYWSGGSGSWEYVFAMVMLILAFKGLKNYYFIAIGWLLHAGWDVWHHLYGHPIVLWEPASCAGCAVCDPIIALWFCLGAPTVGDLFKKKQNNYDIKCIQYCCPCTHYFVGWYYFFYCLPFTGPLLAIRKTGRLRKPIIFFAIGRRLSRIFSCS